MNSMGSVRVVLLAVALPLASVSGCADDERDSGIYSSGTATYDGADDEADEAESTEAGESTTTTGDATTDDEAEATTATSTDDDTTASTSSTSTTDSESDGNGACGNGIIDEGEQCDGADLAGFSCVDLGYTGGTLACDPNICVYDAAGCTNDGDGNANECDQYCNGCTCPSDECTICCAQMDKVDACGGGMCSCF